MKTLIFIVCVSLTWNAVVGSNNTEDGSQNKTKRGIIDQTHYYGEPVTIKYIQTPIIHHDSNAAPATNFNFNNPKPIVFHNSNAPNAPNEPPKQVTVEQVVYEYQQTPHNAVSNVHVNQQFQTSPTATVVNVQKQYLPDTIHSPSQTQLSPYLGNQAHIIQQEPTQYSGVATPVHHGAVIHHGQGYSKVLYDPYTVTTSAPIQQHNVNPQAKYVYANGKITYHPLSINNPYPGVVLNARPHNLVLNQNYRPTQKPFKPSPVIPITYNRQVQHKQPIRTTESPRKEEVEEEEEDEEKSNVREEQDEEEVEPEDNARYEEESEEEDEGFKPSAYFSKYKYEDEDEDHDRYREDEEDEERSSSSAREVRKKPKKNYSKSSPNRQHKNDHFKSREGFKTKKHAEYTAPSEYSKFEASGRKPKSEYKSYKYYKTSNNSKPKKEVIESRESEHIPVVHNKKIVHREKWLVTKNTSE